MSKMEVSQGAAGYYEPSLSHQFLPGCGNCGDKHPLAYKPIPQDTEHCQTCGERVGQPGPPVNVPAILTGWHPATVIARFCFWAAKKLANLAKRLD